MTLRISGKNIAIGESLRQHVHSMVEAVIGRYFDGSVSGHVVIAPEGSGYRSDCTLHLSSGMTLQAEGKAQAPYASVDQAVDRIEKRLRRYKRRLKEHHAPANGAGTTERIVAKGSARLKSLSVASAVEELDLTGAPVVVFQHAGSARVNIVYRRRDGAIGWLDPQ